MVFNYINIINAVVLSIIMVPNIIYGIKFSDLKSDCDSAALIMCEQFGRYGCMAMMVVPVLVWRFELYDDLLFNYIFINSFLLSIYSIVWYFYFKKRNLIRALILAIVPFLIFLFDGIILYHPMLIFFSMLFAIGHISITYINHKNF